MPKGGARKGAGRKKGVENKVTTETREKFKIFLDNSSDRIEELWGRVADDNPKAALDVIKDYAEFVLPKLQRSEITGKDGDKLDPMVVILPGKDDRD